MGEYLEVVNLNLLGSQYAIAGTVRGLELLQEEVERRVAEHGGNRARGVGRDDAHVALGSGQRDLEGDQPLKLGLG